MAEPDWHVQHKEAVQRMAQVDGMPPDVRELIHDFNVNPVVDLYHRGLHRVDDIRAVLTERDRHGDDAAKKLYFALKAKA